MTPSKTDYHRARAAIALEARAVPAETTFTTLCPVCNGGQSGEHKLRATRTHNGVLFVCLRASCGFRGFVALDGEGVSKDQAPTRKASPARPWHGASTFDPLRATELMDRYAGFPTLWPGFLERFGVTWTEDLTVFRCCDLDGVLLGHITRDPQKVIRTYRARPDVEMYSAYMREGQHQEPIFLVEDCVSALAIRAHGYSAVALLGTNIPPGLLDRLRGRSVVLYLDPDAQRTALGYGARYDWPVILAGKDPKDCSNLGVLLERYA